MRSDLSPPLDTTQGLAEHALMLDAKPAEMGRSLTVVVCFRAGSFPSLDFRPKVLSLDLVHVPALVTLSLSFTGGLALVGAVAMVSGQLAGKEILCCSACSFTVVILGVGSTGSEDS